MREHDLLDGFKGLQIYKYHMKIYEKSWSGELEYTWAIYNDQTAEVTRNGGLVRESSQNGRVKDL